MNAMIRKLMIPGDFAHPAAKIFVDRIRDVEHIRESIGELMAQHGGSRERVVENLERHGKAFNAAAFPQALKAASISGSKDHRSGLKPSASHDRLRR